MSELEDLLFEKEVLEKALASLTKDREIFPETKGSCGTFTLNALWSVKIAIGELSRSNDNE